MAHVDAVDLSAGMLLQLPADIQRLIFKQPCLGSRELSSLEATSRAVRSLVDEDVWRQALLRTALRVRGWALCDRALLGVRVCALRAATRGIERSVGPVDGRRAHGGRRKTGVARARVTGGAPFLPYLAAPAQLAAALTAHAPSAAASEAGENEEEDVGHFSLAAASLQCLRVRGHEVRYVGTALGGDRAVRGGLPLPQHRHMSLRAVSPLRLVADEVLVAYFEVTIWPRGGGAAEPEWLPQSDCVAVGLGSRDFPLDGRQPGWDSASFGYHSDDGQAFHGHGASGRPLGPACSPGDVVGAGYSLLSRRVFFSRNGVFLGAPYVAPAQLMPLYPLVGLDSRAPVEFNFGASPFALDTASLPPSLHRPATSKLSRVTSLEAAVRSALACVVPAWGPAG